MADGRLAPAESSPQEQYVSAPSSADFLLLKGVAPEYYYSLPDSMPTLKDMSHDLSHLIGIQPNRRYRMDLALDYASYLQARYKPGEYSIDHESYIHSQLLPRVYLSTFITMARRERLQSTVKRAGKRYSDMELIPLRELIGSKLDMQENISEYVKHSQGEHPQSMFANMFQVMLHSRRLLYGDEVTRPKDWIESRRQLAAVLAEHKVLSALQSRWPNTTLGNIEQDRLGEDIIIPKSQDRGVALQVKSSLNPSWTLQILKKDSGTPKVKVPMDPKLHHPFSLNKEQKKELVDFVEEAPWRALQTGVDEIQLAA